MSAIVATLARASLAVTLAATALPAQQLMDTAFVPRLRGGP